MKSVKPGRGPSFMGGVMNAVVAVFGVFWTIMATRMGAPGFFSAFGVVFVLIAAAGAIYNFKNATGKNRFSEFDITDSGEEPDPLNERFGARAGDADGEDDGFEGSEPAAFCPYCGARAEEGYVFCKKCGKKLPE